MSEYKKCCCKLCVNDKPPSLKSLCLNKLHKKPVIIAVYKILSVCINYVLLNIKLFAKCVCFQSAVSVSKYYT